MKSIAGKHDCLIGHCARCVTYSGDMRVAAIQTTASPDRSENLEAAGLLVQRAAGEGAQLIVLPEYFSVAGDPDHLRANAETMEGPTVTWATGLARSRRIWLLAGSFPEVAGAEGGTHLHNTSCLVGPDGAIVAIYRKVHLFDVTLPGTISHESATIAPGGSFCTAALRPPGDGSGALVPVAGLSICYDLRFPEVYRILARQGATIAMVPAAFSSVTGPAHWELLLRARAVEEQLFVIAADQVGDLPTGMPACHGHSMIIDPWGTVLAEQVESGPGVLIADLDHEYQRRIRHQMPVLANCRPDAYRWEDDG
jgi:predicted amidohydrolase